MDVKEVETHKQVEVAFMEVPSAMENYVELYNNSLLSLQGVFNDVVDDIGRFCFHAEIKDGSFGKFPCKFAGTCEFCIDKNYLQEYCEQLSKMYDSSQGECRILDYDFCNKLHLFFEGQQLQIEGTFFDGVERLGFSQEVDQSILPRLLSLFQSRAN